MSPHRRHANFPRKQILVDGRLFVSGGCRSAHWSQLYVIEERRQGVPCRLQPAECASDYVRSALRRCGQIVDHERDGSPGQDLTQHDVHLPSTRLEILTAADLIITQPPMKT